jgi:putative ABC transport system substrate-binding protein
MRRSEFITLIVGAAAAPLLLWPLAARALLLGLGDLGYVDGKNIKIEYRYGSRPETLDALAAELVDLHPDLIITVATPPAIAAKRATTTIPIVMATAGDPVQSGVVASFARPGGNVTGVTLYGTELSAKRVELLKEVLPQAKRIAALGNGRNSYNQYLWTETEPAARALGFDPQVFMVQEMPDLLTAFAAMKRARADALIVLSDALLNSAREKIIALASEHHLPAMYEAWEFVEDGGLISYGPDIAEMTRRSAALVDKVLKGVKPADLPIEQPTKFELAVNLKTAKTLGLDMPALLLARADKLIE